jgi:hypothetical protein
MADWFTIFTYPKPVETSAPASSLELEPVQGAFNRSAMQDRRNPSRLKNISIIWWVGLPWYSSNNSPYLARHSSMNSSRGRTSHLSALSASSHLRSSASVAFGGNSRKKCRNTIDGVYGWTVCQSHPVHFQHLVWSHDGKEPREKNTKSWRRQSLVLVTPTSLRCTVPYTVDRCR